MEEPPKSIVLTDNERKEYLCFKSLAHHDPVTEVNTYGKYNDRLRAWTDKLRKKHSFDEKESFFFR